MTMSRLRTQAPLPLIGFGGAGHEYRPNADYLYDARARRDRRHVVLQLTLAGAGFYRRGDARVLLQPGDAFLDVIPGPFEYGFARESNVPYELVFVSMIGDEAFAWQRRIATRFGQVLRLGEDNPVAPQLLSLVRQQAAGTPRDPFLLGGALYRVLMTVLSLLSSSRVGTSAVATRALRRIHERASDPTFSIAALSVELELSREHLSRAVRAATGRSPLEHLTQVRLERAADLLRRGTDKLRRVAALSGFANANYLCRVFRRRVGVSPAEFRRRSWMTLG